MAEDKKNRKIKQIVVISGKGGTGKTTVVAALARIVQNKVLVDADVDASNLEIVTNAQLELSEPFVSAQVAKINRGNCINCDLCRQYCRFSAVNTDIDGHYIIDEHSCEGCEVCRLVCPADAISIVPATTGTVKRSKTPYGILWHGELSVGRENSGKLVTHLREKAIDDAQNNKADFVIIDGAPGIGCQIIASVTGTDLTIIVTEPTLSALHDLKRVIELTEHFYIRTGLVINKADINNALSKEIERTATALNLPVLAKIPTDMRIVTAMARGKSPVEIGDEEINYIYVSMWNKSNILQ